MTTSLSLRPLSFSGTPLTVIMRSGKPYWIARDLSRALGYEQDNAIPKMVRRLSQGIDDTSPVFREGLDFIIFGGNELRQFKALVPTVGTSGLDGLDRASSVTLLTETGLYLALMRSDMPCAVKFLHWISDKVLPQIRKTGSYGDGRANDNMSDHESRLAALERVCSRKLSDLSVRDDIYLEIERVVRHMVANGDPGVWVRGEFVLVNPTCLLEAWSGYSTETPPSVNMAGRVLSRNRRYSSRESVEFGGRRVSAHRLRLH